MSAQYGNEGTDGLGVKINVEICLVKFLLLI